jgi:hypothetical protein
MGGSQQRNRRVIVVALDAFQLATTDHDEFLLSCRVETTSEASQDSRRAVA